MKLRTVAKVLGRCYHKSHTVLIHSQTHFLKILESLSFYVGWGFHDERDSVINSILSSVFIIELAASTKATRAAQSRFVMNGVTVESIVQ
eukprot:COSAG01_NODE_8534_length_2749_cov_354.406415_2_plen_90_part_00